MSGGSWSFRASSWCESCRYRHLRGCGQALLRQVTDCYLAALSSAAVAGDRFRLEVKERARLGSPETRRLRKQGFVPGVLYGKRTAQAFAVEGERELRSALTGPSGLHAVLDVVLEGKTETALPILKEYQRDPIRGHVRHIDLQEVRLDQPIQATVHRPPDRRRGRSRREGGRCPLGAATMLNVEALPMEVPESIDADVSGMEIGDTLRLEDIPEDRGRHLPGRPARDGDRERVRADRRGRARARRGRGRGGRGGRGRRGRGREGETPEGEAPPRATRPSRHPRAE